MELIQSQETLAQEVVDAAHEVHRILGGPGLLETIYESALSHELKLRGIMSKRQLPVSVLYKSEEVRDPLFLDLLVEDTLIIEIKATGKDYPMYRAQLATYLRLTHHSMGLLINFGKESLSEGITYIVA
ncbi:MAG: GxxExxY protein [Chlamydiia bacterium]|nr:GxxExxY protein [Chlamydiia bacterium]